MSTFSEFLSEWHDRIRRDLAPFADPGTVVSTIVDGRTIGAEWTMRSETCNALFGISVESGVSVRWRDQDLNYRSFFASDEMADLLGLAKMILQAAPRNVFVDTPARIPDADSKSAVPATALLQKTLLEAREYLATAIIVVTGDAGAGKTSVLQELVKRQAAAYTGGQSDQILLYVNAQGRALARLDEALATELSDLRARLTYHAVPMLTRLGLIVPVIDGFDELLGVSGYDEAFSSLSRFVEDLNGEGQIIASARSTYYEQEFAARANSVSSLGAQIWQQVPVQVLDWREEEVNAYFDQKLQTEGLEVFKLDIRNAFDRAFSGNNAALEKKPFFVARVLKLVIEGETFDQPGQLLESLVRAYADREVDKLRGRAGEALLDRSEVVRLLEEMAEEMWNEESRELDRRSTRDVAEFVLATHAAPENVQRYVIERMPAMAFLTPGTRQGSVAFEHESFFAYFLGIRLAERLSEEPIRLHGLLGRSPMPEDVANAAAELVVGSADEQEIKDVLSRLSLASGIESTRAMQVRENAGQQAARLMALWCHGSRQLSEVSLDNVVIPGSEMKGVTLAASHFANVELRRVDLRRTRFIGCEFREGLLHEVTVDPSFTKLEFSEFDPSSQLLGLRVVTEGGIVAEYDPIRVRKVLAECGMDYLLRGEAVPTYHVRSEIVDMVERIVRAYQRSNPISVNEEEPRTSVIWHMPDWPRVEELLIETGVVREEHKSTRGAKKTFLRRQVRAEEILAGMDPTAVVARPIRDFWERLANEFALAERA